MRMKHLIIFVAGFGLACLMTDASTESSLEALGLVVGLGLVAWFVENVDEFPWSSMHRAFRKIFCAFNWHDWGTYADGEFCYWCSVKRSDGGQKKEDP